MRALFTKRPHPYYIYAHDYRRTSAGVRVLHMLCDALNQSGQEAYVYAEVVNPDLMTPQLTTEIVQLHRSLNLEPIMVYPEVIDYNPFKGNVVVRYLLNTPGLLAGSGIYDENDILFAFAKSLLQEGMPADHVMLLPPLDLKMFRLPDDPGKRIPGKICFSLGRDRKNLIDPALLPADSIEITQTYPSSWEEMVDIFQQCEFFYTADSSALSAEAVLCGCLSVILPNEHTKLIGVEELGTLGVAIGNTPAEIERARNTMPLLREKLENEGQLFWVALDHFIDVTQQRAREYTATHPPAIAAATPAPLPQKKRILVFSSESPLSPCPQIRLLRPFAYLNQEWELIWGIKDGKLLTDEIGQADMILMHRYTPGLLSISSLEAIFGQGKPVIYETDDLLNEMPDYHPQGGAAWKEGIEYTVRHACAVVVSTPFLAEKYRPLNPVVYILPNFIDFDTFYQPVPQGQRDVVTIGLLGTSIQSPNFDLVDATLRALCDQYQSLLKIYFVGWEMPKGWENHPNAEFIPVIVEYADYAARLQQMQWDIALVPLAADNFNRSKSAIKWLEYSATGIATVFSDVPIYSDVVTHGETGLLAADSVTAWTDAITSLIEDAGYRSRIATAAQIAVRRDYALQDKATLYGETYQQIAENIANTASMAKAASTVTPASTGITQAQSAKKRLVVLSIESTWSPCPQIRFILPFMFLQDQWELIWGIADGKINFAEMQRADLIVLHRFTPGLFPPKDLQTIYDMGKPMVYETDDLLNDIPDYHPQAADSKKWKPGIEFAVKNSHAVVVSTPFLADKYRAMNPRIHVLPNYLDFDRFYRPVPEDKNGITIGLLGTSIQGPNFALVEGALRTLCDRMPGKIKIYFMGWTVPAGWETHPAVQFLPFVHEYQSYAQRLLEMQWDIALIPLVNDDFNHSKSAIKWLEYAAAGIAPIFSDVSVYRNVVNHGHTGLLVEETPDAWFKALTLLIENPALRRQIARTAQAEVRKHYSLNSKAALYDQVYRSLTGADKTVAATGTPSPSEAGVRGVLLLDAEGDAAKVEISLRSLADPAREKLMTIVLTIREGKMPEWTDSLRYVQVGPGEYAMGVEKLSSHPDFDWVAIMEAGTTLEA